MEDCGNIERQTIDQIMCELNKEADDNELDDLLDYFVSDYERVRKNKPVGRWTFLDWKQHTLMLIVQNVWNRRNDEIISKRR